MTEDDKRKAIYNAVKALPRLRNIPVKTEADAHSRAEIFERIFWGLVTIDGLASAAGTMEPHFDELLEDVGNFYAKDCHAVRSVQSMMDAHRNGESMDGMLPSAECVRTERKVM